MSLLLLLLLGAATPDDPRADPWFAEPRLRGLMDWVTFRLTFDRETLTPDMAAGEATLTTAGTPRFAPGLHGQALLAGEGSASGTYRRAGNAQFARRGAISLWVKPVDWTHENAPYGIFLVTTNASLYLQRQGPVRNAEGRFTRIEGLQFIVRPKGVQKLVMTDTAKWPNGQWRLIVANWDWPNMALSIDGGDFQPTTYDHPVEDEAFGDLVVGSQHGEQTLLDELTIYRRPLSRDEAKLLHTTFSPTEAQP